MKYWEIIGHNLSKAGWSWGCVSAIDREGERSGLLTRIARGKRFVVRADKKLTAILEPGSGPSSETARGDLFFASPDAVSPLPAGTAGPLDPTP